MSDSERRKQAVTSHDVARAAGVSRASVSRAFAPDGNISDELRARVLQVAEDIGYSVNQIARGLNRQRSDLVGIIVSRLDNPYRAAQVEQLTTRIATEGLRPLLFCIQPSEPVEDTLRLLLDYQVSGVVITSGAPDDRIVEECARKSVPLVLVDRPQNKAGLADHVRGDNAKGGQLVAQALHEAGRRTVTVFSPRKATYSLTQRVESLLLAARELGLRVQQKPMVGYDYEAGFTSVTKVLAQNDAIHADGSTALFLPNDVSALGALDALRQAGIDVPDAVGLMGYDDIPQASWSGTSLSTVRQDPVGMAEAVVTLLKRRILDPESACRDVQLAVELRLRRTH